MIQLEEALRDFREGASLKENQWLKLHNSPTEYDILIFDINNISETGSDLYYKENSLVDVIKVYETPSGERHDQSLEFV